MDKTGSFRMISENGASLKREGSENHYDVREGSTRKGTIICTL